MTINGTVTTLALGAAALGLAAGCGSATGGHPATTPESASSARSQAPPEGNSGYSAGPGDGPVSQTVRLGQPFNISYAYSNGGEASWRMSLQSVACGSGAIFAPKILAASDASVPRPDPGMQFCLAKFTVTNQGHSQDTWSVQDSTSVNVGMDAYTDETMTGPGRNTQDAYNAAEPNPQYGLDPHATGESWGVYQIPSGAKATSVSVAEDTALHTIDGPSFQALIMLAGNH